MASRNAVGDCYEAALHTMVEMHEMVRPHARLCHGVVTGNAAPVMGVRFGHAWVETSGLVIDNSNGHATLTPMESYYQRGSIEPNEVVRYAYDEMCKTMLRFKHYGPWHK